MINGEGNFFEKRFGGMKKSCTFAVLQISVDSYIRIYHKK